VLAPLARLLQTTPLETAKLVVSVVALIGTAIAAVIAIKSFRRTEQWKRAEFLASEMKEFFANPKVANAFLLIDWGSRRIPLLPQSATNQGMVGVTRALQVSALLPHTIVEPQAGSDIEQLFDGTEASIHGTEASIHKFSTEEAAIRDCYDALLDGLERFASYVQTNLIDSVSLRPYLGYWIDDIHASTKDPADAAWSAALLTYITFYRYNGVLRLFREFDRDISCSTPTYRGFLAGMQDQQLALKLAQAVNVEYAVPHRSIGSSNE
jgi:hypothetical protein